MTIRELRHRECDEPYREQVRSRATYRYEQVDGWWYLAIFPHHAWLSRWVGPLASVADCRQRVAELEGEKR